MVVPTVNREESGDRCYLKEDLARVTFFFSQTQYALACLPAHFVRSTYDVLRLLVLNYSNRSAPENITFFLLVNRIGISSN